MFTLRKCFVGLLLCLAVAGCALPETSAPASPGPPMPAEVRIRLRNNSDSDFDRVEVNFVGQAVQYGSLPHAATSDYRAPEKAYGYAYIKATAGDAEYVLQPIDYVGEHLLPPGDYTYELDVENGQLTLLLINETPFMTDARIYAEQMGVELAEAVRRLQAQEDVGELGALLEANEADTFAGLWIQHEPEYRIVVAFTRDGEETLRPYIEGNPLADKIEVRAAGATYVELQAAQQAALRLTDKLGLAVATGINIQANQVELYVTDRPRFDAALQEANAQLPEHVAVITVYEPVGDHPPLAVTSVPNIFMPQLKARDASYMEALLVGELMVEDGCLRIKPDHGGESILVVWQADYFLNDHDGVIEILNETGRVVAKVGEEIRMGGGEVPFSAELEKQLREPIPEQCAAENVWLMGDILLEQ